MNSKSTSVIEVTNDDSQIQPQFRLRFVRSSSHIARGQCLVDILIKNGSVFAASFPFLCLTNLGLTVGPAPGWVKEETIMVRKILRFSSGDVINSVLEAGATAHCCTVTLRYKLSFGGCLEFESGSEYLLANFPNLNLMCAVGAGNFPSRRILLQVPATSLRKIIGKPIKTAEASHFDQVPNDNALNPDFSVAAIE